MMLRGCEKRVVHVKNTGNEWFEEAYFFLRPDISEGKPPSELWREAEKIVQDSLVCGAPPESGNPRLKNRIRFLITFAVGLLCGGGAMLFFC